MSQCLVQDMLQVIVNDIVVFCLRRVKFCWQTSMQIHFHML